jgi:hypothetical protein
MAEEKTRHEFRVIIDGVDLDQDVQERMNAAIQKAAVTELASVDLRGDFRLRFPFPLKRPPWLWGIWIDPISQEQLDLAGIETPPEFGGGR